jgi:hypothetical protein
MMNNLPPGVTDSTIEYQQEHSYTRQDVELLKSQWASDPCWDIENTEGFENYYIELKAFALGCELEWKQQRESEARAFSSKIESKAKQLNCSLELAKYILNLEETISEMRDFLIEIGY